MQVFRWLEPITALVGTVFGLFQIYHVLFDPIYSYASSTGEPGRASLLQQPDKQVNAIIVISLEGLVLLVAITSATIHARTRQVIWQRILWGTVVFLIIWSLLGIGTIGFMLIPAALLVLLSAVFSLGVGRA
jgi:hypothetical protein